MNVHDCITHYDPIIMIIHYSKMSHFAKFTCIDLYIIHSLTILFFVCVFYKNTSITLVTVLLHCCYFFTKLQNLII